MKFLSCFKKSALLLVCLNQFALASNLEVILEGTKFNDPLVKSGMGHLISKRVYSEYGKAKAKNRLKQLRREGIKNVMVSGIHDTEAEIFYAFEGKKIRCDIKSIGYLPNGQPYTYLWKQAFDGEKMMDLHLDYIGPGGTIIPTGTIRSENIIDRSDLPNTWGITFHGIPIAEFLQGKPLCYGAPEATSIEVVGIEKIAGDVCYVVKLKYEVKEDSIVKVWISPREYKMMQKSEILNGEVKVWISPQKGYRIRKVETFDKNGNLTTSSLITFRQYPGNIWFPKRIVNKIFEVDELTGRSNIVQEHTIIVQDDFEINVDVPDNLFTINFPKGLPVYDMRINKSFTVH